MNFLKHLPKFLSDKMTLCNNNDQTWFSNTLGYARPLWIRLNPRLSGSGFNITLGVQQMLMHRKMCLIPIVIYYTIIDFNEVDIRIYLPEEKVIIHRGR